MSFDMMPGVVYRAREGWTRQGHGRVHVDYLHDVGYLHYGDYALHHAGWFHLLRKRVKSASQRIGRYLDGEEEREGTYR